MTISPLASTPQTAPTTGAGQSSAPAGSSNSGQLDGLTPLNFIQMLATELENQDPTNPMDPSQILQQTSTIANLESMSTMTSSTQQTEATGLIGKTITGTAAGQPITGQVTDIQIDPSSGTPTAMVNGIAVALSTITDISGAASASGSSSTTTSSSSTGGSNQ